MNRILACFAVLVGTSLSLSAGSYNVYVGYADSLRGAPDFPNPFAVGETIGAATVTNVFGVCSGGGCDSGAVMIVNTGSTALTVNHLSVNDRANGAVYDIWGSLGLTLAANSAAIFLENSGNNFDSSDFGGNTNPQSIAGFDPNTNNCSVGAISLLAQCVNNSPIVTFTVDGVGSDLFDTGHVLDTGGFDTANYLHNHSDGSVSYNESLQWRAIGTTGVNDPGGVPEPGTWLLLGSGLVAVASRRNLSRR